MNTSDNIFKPASDGARQSALLTARLVEITSLPRTRSFTTEELREAFRKIQPPSHWKDPISVEIAKEDMELVDQSIAFVAYGGARFVDLGNGRVHVTAPGYWGMEAYLENEAASGNLIGTAFPLAEPTDDSAKPASSARRRP